MITALIGLISAILMGGLKKADIIRRAAPLVKQLVVVGIAALVNLVRVKMGYEVPGDLQAWAVSAVLSALAAFGFYNLYESNIAQRATSRA